MLVVVASTALPGTARASMASAIEIDPRAETLLEPRALRRLIQLELSDVAVPPPLGQLEAALFVRVLSAGDGELRVELWERGVAYGARQVTGATRAAPLLARRVALAVAELARELADTREDEAEERRTARQLAARQARDTRERTRDGPRAVRVGATGLWSPHLALVAPSLAAELHAYRRVRFDLDAAWGLGTAFRRSPVELWSVGIGPALRLPLGSHFDLDAAARAGAAVLGFSDVRSADGIASQRQTWSASVEARVRLEPHLGRSLRLLLGVGAGLLLRRVPLVLDDGEARRLGGGFLGVEAGVVITPF